MSEEPYKKREIDDKFNRMIENQTETNNHLIEIKRQVTVTNGRVTKLEQWRWMIIGAFSIVSMIIVPILLFMITSFLK